MKKIAIEKGLTDLQNKLSNAGYSIEEFDKNSIKNSSFSDDFDAVVVTAQNANAMGHKDTEGTVLDISNGLIESRID